MILKKRLKNLLYYGVATTVSVSASVGVVSYVRISLNSTYNDAKSNNSESNNQQENLSKTYLDQKISNLNIPTIFYSIPSNQYYDSLNVSSLLNDYTNNLKNESIDNFAAKIQSLNSNFTISDFYKDILFFLKNIYSNSNEKISMKILKDDFSVSSSTISFDYILDLKNNTGVTTSFNIENQSFYIPANSTRTLEIKTTNSSYYFGLTKSYNDWYLDWNTNVDFIYGDKTYNFSNFSFTKNNFSPSIQTYVNGISDTLDYSTINNDSEYFSNLSTDSLKNNIGSYLSKNIDFSLEIMKYFAPILEETQKNNTVYSILNNQKDNLSEMILTILGINSSNSNYSSYKKLFSDLLNPSKMLLNVISDNGQALSNLIAYFINSPSITGDVIYTYIKNINPNATENELNQQEQDLSSLILYFINSMGSSVNIDSNFIMKLLSTVFQKNTTALSLISFIFSDNQDTILDLISNDKSTRETYKQYIDLVNLLINDPTQRILDLLMSNNGKQLISSIISNMMGSNSVQGDTSNSLILSLVNQIISNNNTNFTTTNFESLLSDLIIPIVKFLSSSDNYTINKEFKSISYSDTDKTVSYEYNLSFVFKNSITFNLNSILDILPNTLKFGKTSIPKSILTTILKQDGKAFQITIGSGDKINFNFSGVNEKIYLNPTYSSFSGNYQAGYCIPYHLVMRFDMPTMFNSITSFYEISLSVLGVPSHPINDSIVNSLKVFLSDFLIRDYDFYGIISFTDSSKVISNYSSNIYRENNYFKWKSPPTDFYTNLKNNITYETNNTYSLKFIKSNAFSSKTVYESISGKKPVINSNFIETIKNSVMDYKSDVDPVISITPEVNSSIPISIVGISLSNVEITLVKINVWFPYKVLDLSNSSNPKLSNSFSVELSLM